MQRLLWCAEAEPRLLDLRDRLESGQLTAADALIELGTLVGHGRFARDWDAAQLPCPALRDPGLFASECFSAAHPPADPLHRVYSLTPNQYSVYAAIGLELGLLIRTGDGDDATVSRPDGSPF